MTNLYIDGIAVVLPSEFSITVKQENAFFTKNGEYTYDIELSLLVPENAKLYGFLNRLNITDRPAHKRKAVLVADNRVYLNGTEIITGWTDERVSIQLVSGNSELNYFVGSDELISTLAMKETNPVVNGSVSTDYVKKTYPDVDYNLMMTYDSLHQVDKNIWLYRLYNNDINNPYAGYIVQKENIQPYDYIPQPYLCAYMRELLKALGYTLEYNAIEDTPYKSVYIVHVCETYKWNEMLPGWTAKDFLQNIETMFNGSFLIDHRTKKVSFLLNVSYLPKVRNVHLQNVVDAYTVEVEEEEESDAVNSTIKYKLPSSEYYKMRCLPDVVKEAAKHKVIDEGLFAFFGKPENQVTDTIFDYQSVNRKIIYLEGSGIMSNLEMVDELASLVRENAESELELEFVPAELTERAFYMEGIDPGGFYFGQYYIPSVSVSDDEPDETTYDSIHNMVNNLSEKTESKSNIFLAFFRGLNPVQIGVMPANSYPLAFIDRFFPTTSWPATLPSDYPTFNLVEMEKYFYSNAYKIDRKNAIKITCYDSNLYPASSVFEIFNRRYLAKEIEYTIGPNGRTKAWTGTFYPASISDTEVQQRWILSDGKWRDGGVWLDNGRWLDS
ncbi:hypothetical protein [Phocaeicola plebeius]|uniref:hypothetical protein n=1 Tax=Phocaeicola plebeius TaxID=310297 RepID=UPI0026EC9E1A|nr:hypothetical protein [Phocaeicola plebeius]